MKGGRDILSEYGSDVSHPQAPRAGSGGVTRAETLNYDPPKGPANMHHVGPGLGQHNHGHNQQAHTGPGYCSGSPGLHGGTTHKGGSQRG